MKRRMHLRLKQLGTITIAWLAVALFMSLYDHLVLLTGNSQGVAAGYSFVISTLYNLGSALMGALLGGSFLVFFINVRYADKPYGFTVVAVTLSFILVIMLIIAVLGMVSVPVRTGRPLSDPLSVEAFKDFLRDSSRAKNIMTWSLVVAATQLLLQINSKFGPGALANFVCGKYNTPRQEKRIFMFLDLNASTTIAERLGDEKYHTFLKDFFADITHPVLDNKGEIYQYVGDEVVVTWKYEEGIEHNRCVQCFFDIKDHLDSKKEKYFYRYGLVPSFKAGIHCGMVMAGEVGIIKRDITYSGDVLNTTARIVSMCNEFNAEVIASAELITALSLANNYTAQPLGSIKLKGKAKEVLLSALGYTAASRPQIVAPRVLTRRLLPDLACEMPAGVAC